MLVAVLIIVKLLELVQLILILRLLLSWFPNINWYSQPFRFINDVTYPILEPFRRLIPPIGGMLDISPLIPLFLLYVAINVIASLAY